MRRRVSRQEIPASMRMLVPELERTAGLPREPEASTVIRTMERRIDEKPVGKRVIIRMTSHFFRGRNLNNCHPEAAGLHVAHGPRLAARFEMSPASHAGTATPK